MITFNLYPKGIYVPYKFDIRDKHSEVKPSGQLEREYVEVNRFTDEQLLKLFKAIYTSKEEMEDDFISKWIGSTILPYLLKYIRENWDTTKEINRKEFVNTFGDDYIEEFDKIVENNKNKITNNSIDDSDAVENIRSQVEELKTFLINFKEAQITATQEFINSVDEKLKSCFEQLEKIKP